MKNNYEKIDIRIVSEDTSCFKKLDEFQEWEDNFGKVNFVGLFINDEMFLNEYAKKIFQNILVNGCEFEQTIKYNEYYYPNIMIVTREISYLECVEKIRLIMLMIERANDISKLIIILTIETFIAISLSLWFSLVLKLSSFIIVTSPYYC